MKSEPARLSGISLDFTGIPTRWRENLFYEYAQVGQPDKVGQNFVLLFRFQLNNVRTFILHDDFTSLFIVNTTWLNSLFPATNFFIKLSDWTAIWTWDKNHLA